MRDENGMILWNRKEQMCIEEDMDEDFLALQTRSVRKQVPTMAVELDSLVEQNQQLQTELGQSQFAHQTDVERAQELMAQKEVQNQADFKAMTAELEWKKVELMEE